MVKDPPFSSSTIAVVAGPVDAGVGAAVSTPPVFGVGVRVVVGDGVGGRTTRAPPHAESRSAAMIVNATERGT